MFSTDAADISSWQRAASRAGHPSATPPLLGPGDLLVEIAAGMGHVAIPADLGGAPSRGLSRELVLSTPAYHVWVMHWPAGEAADLHAHDEFVAFHVVSGHLVEERVLPTGIERFERAAATTTLVPPHTMHRLVSTTSTTTVHVHARGRG